MKNRLDRSKFNIGTYYLAPYATSEQHIKDLADCGIDMIVNMKYDKNAFDLLHKYGVKVILADTYPICTGIKPGIIEESNAFEHYEAGAASFIDHPAICGINVADEPSALTFPYYGKIIDFTKNKFPNQFPYLNLFPNYASVAQNSADEALSQLGTATYEEHINRYCQLIGLDYICYDFYVYVYATSVAEAYENMRIVADACQKTGRSFWIVLQVNSYDPNAWTSENQLRFQAYTAMAFGAELITWACYTAGWWHNHVLDKNGEKTEQYEKLKKVNHELKALGETYMKYRRTATHFVGFDNEHPDMQKLPDKPKASLSTGIFLNITADAPVVIGQMTGKERTDGSAILIAAADDPYDKNPKEVNVTFQVRPEGGYTITAHQGNTSFVLTPDAAGNCHVTLTSCSGLLITAK